MLVLPVVFTVANNSKSVVRARVWNRARARMARKASWSVVQVLLGAQAVSVRVPFLMVVLLLPPVVEAKVAFMARKEGR